MYYMVHSFRSVNMDFYNLNYKNDFWYEQKAECILYFLLENQSIHTASNRESGLEYETAIIQITNCFYINMH